MSQFVFVLGLLLLIMHLCFESVMANTKTGIQTSSLHRTFTSGPKEICTSPVLLVKPLGLTNAQQKVLDTNWNSYFALRTNVRVFVLQMTTAFSRCGGEQVRLKDEAKCMQRSTDLWYLAKKTTYAAQTSEARKNLERSYSQTLWREERWRIRDSKKFPGRGK